MKPYLKPAGIGLSVGALIAIVTFPVFRMWVDEFQTLITGLAAVAGAVFTIGKMDETIRTMERTDAMAERRHHETISLALRADRLRVQRLLFPQLGNLITMRDGLRALQHFPVLEPPEATLEITQKNLEEFSNIALGLAQLLERPQWVDAKPLWGGTLTFQVDLLKSYANKLIGAAMQAKELKQLDIQQLVTADQLTAVRRMQLERLREIPTTALVLRNKIDDVVDLLVKLAAEYQIKEF